MKIIAIIVMVIMTFVANNANADVIATVQSYENVSKYAHKAIPDVTDEEITACYDAVKNGGSYQIQRKKVKIECAEEEMIVFRRLF